MIRLLVATAGLTSAMIALGEHFGVAGYFLGVQVMAFLLLGVSGANAIGREREARRSNEPETR